MRVLLLMLGALAGCSGGDVGGDAGVLLPPSEGADPQLGSDPGSGEERGTLPLGARCTSTSQCAHGSCLKSGVATKGFCLTLCWAGPLAPTSTPIEPCARGESCVRSRDSGICLAPCTTMAECPSGLVCGKVSTVSGRFCVPSSE